MVLRAAIVSDELYDETCLPKVVSSAACPLSKLLVMCAPYNACIISHAITQLSFLPKHSMRKLRLLYD
eukprot:413-Heterococcus_DN1.PRE.2